MQRTLPSGTTANFGKWTDSFTGITYAYIHSLSSLVNLSFDVREVIRLTRCDHVLLRTREALADPTWTLRTVWVVHPSTDAPQPTTRCTVHPMTDHEQGFVEDLLAHALLSGYGLTDGALPRAKAFAHELFTTDSPAGQVGAFVATQNGVLVGHVTYRMPAPRRENPNEEQFVEMLDLSVLPEARGGGTSAALQSALLDHASRFQLSVLGNVSARAAGEGLLDRLVQTGWREAWRTYDCDWRA